MRRHVHQENFAASQERVFAILHTPSAIRHWWSASQAIVIAKEGGLWTAAWGADEDDPDYISMARLKVFDAPRRIVFSDIEYYAKSGPLPFQADLTTEFIVAPDSTGTTLRVVQDGFPLGSEADAFYDACRVGWENTFAGIRRYLENETK